jgi:hypothetical protein
VSAAVFTVHKDNPGGWYVAENGVPVAFYATKAQAERGADIKRRLRSAWR